MAAPENDRDVDPRSEGSGEPQVDPQRQALEQTMATMREQAEALLAQAERDRKFARSIIASLDAYEKGQD